MEKVEKISPLEIIKQDKRSWETVTVPAKVEYILKEYLMLKDLTLKGFEQKPEIYYSERKSDGTYIFKTEPTISFSEKHFTIYKTLNKHIEIDMEVTSIISNGVLRCKPVIARIAKENRKQSRILDRENMIISSNFMVAKENVDISKILGFSGQLIFSDIEKELKLSYPNSKLVPLTKQTPLNEEVEIVRRKNQIVFVTDIDTMTSPKNLNCFDLITHYLEEGSLDEKITQFRKEKIKSFVYYPISFQIDQKKLLIGYGYTYSSQSLPIEILSTYKDIEENLNKKIMDFNITVLSVKQNIINICEGGMLLDITDPNLQKSILIKPSFTMDITFKLQPPLRFAVEVKHVHKFGTSLFVGVAIAGSNDTEKAMENYRSFLHFINKKNTQ
ncbi:MAG: DUF1577 domain-containing protein [Leptospiraceae bacterium]|nr:DUF1577 domain-containing protein [Leptospiraceae bacterium]MCK6382377.1 DUF1577 domain-containing protein [Leptospiraceae bacterium]NUM41174.1 DUF1577 domain-containing protein [Leptospiraceae bacterium]